jgi:hypothetical protein
MQVHPAHRHWLQHNSTAPNQFIGYQEGTHGADAPECWNAWRNVQSPKSRFRPRWRTSESCSVPFSTKWLKNSPGVRLAKKDRSTSSAWSNISRNSTSLRVAVVAATAVERQPLSAENHKTGSNSSQPTSGTQLQVQEPTLEANLCV